MTTSTAEVARPTKDAPTITTLIDGQIGNPAALPNGQTVALSRVATYVRTPVGDLVALAQEKGVPVQRIGLTRQLQGRDLVGLIGEESARLCLLEGRPEFIRTDGVSFILPLARSEIPTFCALRGVAISAQGGNPTMSTLGVGMLKAILDAEKAQELPADDWVPWRDAIEKLRENQHFRRVAQVAGLDARRDEPRYVELINELEARCEASDVRKKTVVNQRHGQKGEPVVCSYDLFRMCGIEIPGADIELYRMMMVEAFDNVMGLSGALP